MCAAQDMEGTQKLPHINACLTCLNTTQYAESILMDTEWMKLIEYCTGLMVDLNSRMWKICSQCSEQVQDYAKFKQKCEKSDTFWKSILSGNSICQIDQHDTRTSADNVKNKYESDPFKTQEPFSNYGTVNNIACKEETCYDDFDRNDSDNAQVEYMLPERKPGILVPINDEKDELKKESITQTVASPDTDNTKYKCDSLKVSSENHVKKCKKIKRNEVELSSLPLSEELYYCGLCKMTSSSLDAINKHVLDEHSSKNDLNCKICDYVGRDFAQMEVHRFSHSPEDLKSKWACHICGFSPVRSAWRAYNFEFHYRKKHLNKNGGLCKLCGKSYVSLRLWRRHEKWHFGEEYICDYCGKSFTLKFSLQSHIISLHFSIKDYVCEVCGMTFARKFNLEFHKQNKHTTTERVSCPHCLKSLKNKNYLNKHILRLHMKHEHKFICEFCSKSYPSQKELKLHMIWHKSDRPFPCEICGLRFKVKSQLKSHQNTVHAGLRHFKCDVCDSAFSSTTQRKRHYFVHTGVPYAPHKCKYCTREFNSKKQLNKHNLSFHKDILTS